MKEVQMEYIVTTGKERKKAEIMKRPEIGLNDVSEELYRIIFFLVQ